MSREEAIRAAVEQMARHLKGLKDALAHVRGLEATAEKLLKELRLETADKT